MIEMLVAILSLIAAYFFVSAKKAKKESSVYKEEMMKGKLDVIEAKARAHSGKPLDVLIEQSNARYNKKRGTADDPE